MEGPKGSYANREAFARALDAHLQELQQQTPAYRSGYLWPFDEDPPSLQRTIRFGIQGDLQATLFVINGRNYNKKPDKKPTKLQLQGGHDFMPGHNDYLGKDVCDGGRGRDGQEPWPLREGTEEEWTITNDSEVNHPFHIHVNLF